MVDTWTCAICYFESKTQFAMGKHFMEKHQREWQKIDFEVTIDEMVKDGLVRDNGDETFSVTQKGIKILDEHYKTKEEE